MTSSAAPHGAAAVGRVRSESVNTSSGAPSKLPAAIGSRSSIAGSTRGLSRRT